MVSSIWRITVVIDVERTLSRIFPELAYLNICPADCFRFPKTRSRSSSVIFTFDSLCVVLWHCTQIYSKYLFLHPSFRHLTKKNIVPWIHSEISSWKLFSSTWDFFLWIKDTCDIYCSFQQRPSPLILKILKDAESFLPNLLLV